MTAYSDIKKRLSDQHQAITFLVDGKEVPATAEQRDAILHEWTQNAIDYGYEKLRNRRNVLLAASDWTQVGDTPVDAVAWAKYRQALRDLPETTDDPTNVVWPEPPK